MNEYDKRVKKFLKDTNATVTITYIGKTVPPWDKSYLHDTYRYLIKTTRSSMEGYFYDSTYNTELNEKRRRLNHPLHTPSEYDIFSVLNIYEVGSMGDFMDEFGYEIKNGQDLGDFIKTYDVVCEEYRGLCRCFTTEEIETLQEIAS